MRQLHRLSLLLALLPALAAGCSPGPEAPGPKKEIIIGLNPSERSENVQRNARVLADMISRRAGMPVRIYVALDYSGLVEALRSRTVDFAFFAPISYVFAERIADARVLLKAERKGKPYYYGAIVVNADSSYRTIADLKGKAIAWVDPTSTSGHLFPKAALMDAGIDPDRHFSNQIFAGGHDGVLLAVINGTVAAGATFANDTVGASGSWTQLGDGAFAHKIRPIFYSRPIPSDNLSTTQYMIDNYPEVVEKLTHAVRSITDDEEGRKLMSQMYHVDSMIPATSADYEPIRRAAALLKLDISGTIGGGEDETMRRNEMISEIVFGAGALLGIVVLAAQALRVRRRGRRGVPPASATAAARPMPHHAQQASGSLPHASGDAQFSTRHLTLVYRDRSGGELTALRDVSVDIARGEFVAVIGLSGAGKSSFLRCLNRMNEPTSGSVIFEGEDITHVQGKELTAVRRRIGFIFQQFNLVKSLSVMKNVLSGRLSHVSGLRALIGSFPARDREIALDYIRKVGLGDKVGSRARDLSGGQQQRVAIARALAQHPSVILADEPMASLDPKLSEVVLKLLKGFNRDEGITVIVNLHVLELATSYADRIIAFRAGEIAFDGPPQALSPELVETIYHTDAATLDRM